MDKKMLALLGVLLLVIALAAAVTTRALSSTRSSSPGLGTAAPQLQGTTLQGKSFALATGRPTVVNFFASWCPPCRLEAPDLVAFANAHPEVQVIGVATNDAKADTQWFVTEYKLPYTVVMDPQGAIAASWGVDPIPHTFFVDRDGVQRASVVGAMTRAQFEEKLKSIQ